MILLRRTVARAAVSFGMFVGNDSTALTPAGRPGAAAAAAVVWGMPEEASHRHRAPRCCPLGRITTRFPSHRPSQDVLYFCPNVFTHRVVRETGSLLLMTGHGCHLQLLKQKWSRVGTGEFA